MEPRGGTVLVSLLVALFLRADEPGKAITPPPPPLRVTLLGTGNPRPSMTRFGPSILVEAATSPPTRILVDSGRGATQRLFSIGGRDLLSGLDLVLLTHLHSDHVVGLPDLWLTGWLFGRARPLSLKGPDGTAALAAHLEKAFAFDVKTRRDLDEGLPGAGAAIDAKDIPPETSVEISGVKVTAFAVDHGPVKPASSTTRCPRTRGESSPPSSPASPSTPTSSRRPPRRRISSPRRARLTRDPSPSATTS